MKHLYFRLLMAAALLVPTSIFAQSATVAPVKCLTHYMYEEQMNADPAFRQAQVQLEDDIRTFTAQQVAQRNASGNGTSSVVKIIPVVVHVIHEGGSENISRAQIQSQIDSLNKDFRRMNYDAAQTPAVFQPAGGDAEIEFRLATLDPNGNCTDGIVRVFSHLTNEARDNVKALSYWPRNKYLNIWIVKTIENTSGAAGIILGFAQFPGGTAGTDGVEIRSDAFGTIGTATWNSDGRTASHEIGHWLSLRHIWGDAVCGDDFVADTPTQQEANTGCPAWPHITCTNGPDGDMFSNYMDYTDGACQDIFSNGQCTRMNAALNSPLSGRNNLWTSTNLIATGTNTIPGAVCVPIAEFTSPVQFICEGTTVNFTDGSWNSPPTSWSWDFPGGTPSTSTDQNPTVQYNTPGTYDVSLTATNSAGADSYTQAGAIIVYPSIGQYTIPYFEGFETATFPGPEWVVQNESGTTWVQNTTVSHSGSKSVSLYNYTGNTSQTTDIFYTPTYNLSTVSNANLYFWLAFAARSATSTDQMKVYASTTCGQLWNIRYNKVGANLSTAGIITSNFTPTAAQWRQETVNIASSSYTNKPNVRFKFEYLQSNGNNIFIDDLNLDGLVGINEAMESSLDFSVYPNPVMSKASIEFTLDSRQPVRIDVVDVMGRVVNQISETTLDAGGYQFELPGELASGLYGVRLNVNGYVTVRKVIIN